MKVSTFLALVLCGIPMYAHASDAFTSTDAAASAALHQIQEVSARTNSEYGFLIYELDGSFYFTDAVTDHSKGTVKLHGKFPKNAHLAAIAHSHPGDSDIAEQFSQSDLDVARTLKVPSYIIATKSGHIHCFIDGIDHTQLDTTHKLVAISFGHNIS